MLRKWLPPDLQRIKNRLDHEKSLTSERLRRRAIRAAEPELLSKREKASRHGLSIAELELLVSTAKICPICKEAATSIDRCPHTGRVRGVLCRRCKLLVGYLEDPLRDRAEAYLKRARRANANATTNT